jgi:calcineurin-like phosphoesterase family protein
MTHTRPWPLILPRDDVLLVHHVSDTHFGYRPWSYTESGSMLQDLEQGLVPRVDLFLHTGDIIDGKNDAVEDAYAVDWLNDAGAQAGKTLWTMGNHDIRSRVVHTRATWEAKYGRSVNSYVDVKGVRFITFSVDDFSPTDYLWQPTPATWDWVDARTNEFSGPVVLVNHYPPKEIGVLDQDALITAVQLNDLIGDNPNVIGFMCGHMHFDLNEPRLASFLALGGRKLPVLCDISSMLSLEGEAGRDQSAKIQSTSAYVEIVEGEWRIRYRRHGGHAWGGPHDQRVTTMHLGTATVTRGM